MKGDIGHLIDRSDSLSNKNRHEASNVHIACSEGQLHFRYAAAQWFKVYGVDLLTYRQTPIECARSELNSDTICPEIASDSTGL